MIDLTVDSKTRKENVKYCKQRGITLPTFAMMKDPTLIPDNVKESLTKVGLWDINPLNLYRITWKNQPKEKEGGFSNVNHIVFPSELTGCKANIVALVGKWFPTGAHKVGATYGCLIPKLVTGQFNPLKSSAVWPSTGNFCRGGAYVSALLGCKSIAILPEQMSEERFNWLKKVAGEVIATHGCESNVKEIFDKCWELKKTRKNINIFNQFEEFGNPLWHYNVTGPAMEEVLKNIMGKDDNFFGVISSSGSGGTMASSYYLKTKFPNSKLAVAEALQCPTLLNNGFGDHKIEGIGDKHVPWIHDVKNTDCVISVDDKVCIRLLRLFNEEIGHNILNEYGVSKDFVKKLNLLGISGIGNLLGAIKFAKYFELTKKDYLFTICTDSMDLYSSRLTELEQERGLYTEIAAHKDMQIINDVTIDNMKELTYYDKKAIHNLKYYTWVEQQQKKVTDLMAQWYDHKNYWNTTMNQVKEIDELITEFNELL